MCFFLCVVYLRSANVFVKSELLCVLLCVLIFVCYVCEKARVQMYLLKVSLRECVRMCEFEGI